MNTHNLLRVSLGSTSCCNNTYPNKDYLFYDTNQTLLCIKIARQKFYFIPNNCILKKK